MRSPASSVVAVDTATSVVVAVALISVVAISLLKIVLVSSMMLNIVMTMMLRLESMMIMIGLNMKMCWRRHSGLETMELLLLQMMMVGWGQQWSGQ